MAHFLAAAQKVCVEAKKEGVEMTPELLKERVVELVSESTRVLRMIKKHKQDRTRWFETQGRDLLVKSFKFHDADSNDLLNLAEAKVFFHAFVAEQSSFKAAVAVQAKQLLLEAVLRSGQRKYAESEPEKLLEFQEKMPLIMQKTAEAAEKTSEARLQNYLSHKDDHDAAAFELMDANGDGTITLEQFLAYFGPDSSAAKVRLYVALGFLSEKEALQIEETRQWFDEIHEGE